MSRGYKEFADDRDGRNDETIFSPRILNDLIEAIRLKLAVKDEMFKLDAISAAIQRPVTVPFDVKHPDMDLRRMLDVFLGQTVDPEPRYFLSSELAHRRIEHSKSCATALAKCNLAAKSFAPMTLATASKISTFLGRIDTHMNAFSVRQAKARVDLFTDQYQTKKQIESMFGKFIENIGNDKSSLLMSDEAYEATVGSGNAAYSINRASPIATNLPTKRSSDGDAIDAKRLKPDVIPIKDEPSQPADQQNDTGIIADGQLTDEAEKKLMLVIADLYANGA